MICRLFYNYIRIYISWSVLCTHEFLWIWVSLIVKRELCLCLCVSRFCILALCYDYVIQWFEKRLGNINVFDILCIFFLSFFSFFFFFIWWHCGWLSFAPTKSNDRVWHREFRVGSLSLNAIVRLINYLKFDRGC